MVELYERMRYSTSSREKCGNAVVMPHTVIALRTFKDAVAGPACLD
jgi:hypothetical protein